MNLISRLTNISTEKTGESQTADIQDLGLGQEECSQTVPNDLATAHKTEHLLCPNKENSERERRMPMVWES